MPVEFEVSEREGDVVAVLTGRLGPADATALRVRLDECLEDLPDAMLIDLAGLVVDDPLALAVFLAFLADAARWPGVPVLFCRPTDEVRVMLTGAEFREMPLFISVTAGREHARSRRRPALTEELLPVAGAARQAREIAATACRQWEQPELVGPATLIVSELVSNAVHHASTVARLHLALDDRHLTVAVQDESPEPPVLRDPTSAVTVRGRGLMLVAAVAKAWGWSPAAGGKVVWATLPRQ